MIFGYFGYFFWSFSENIYKNHGKPWEKPWTKQWKQPWKTMGKTMVNPPNQSISDRFHPFFMVDYHPGKLRNCNFPPKWTVWIPTAQNGSLHQQQNDGWSTNHRCFFPSSKMVPQCMVGRRNPSSIVYFSGGSQTSICTKSATLMTNFMRIHWTFRCQFSSPNCSDTNLPFKSKHVQTRIYPWVIHGYQLYHLCHHIVDIIDLTV